MNLFVIDNMFVDLDQVSVGMLKPQQDGDGRRSLLLELTLSSGKTLRVRQANWRDTLNQYLMLLRHLNVSDCYNIIEQLEAELQPLMQGDESPSGTATPNEVNEVENEVNEVDS